MKNRDFKAEPSLREQHRASQEFSNVFFSADVFTEKKKKEEQNRALQKILNKASKSDW